MASTTWFAIAIIGLAVTAQVLGFRGLNMFSTHACGTSETAAAGQPSCCAANSDKTDETLSTEAQVLSDQDAPQPMPCCPCDGPCDCQTCFRVMLPSPMMASLTALFDLPIISHLSSPHHEVQPKWLALSVAVQPPIL